MQEFALSFFHQLFPLTPEDPFDDVRAPGLISVQLTGAQSILAATQQLLAASPENGLVMRRTVAEKIDALQRARTVRQYAATS